MKCFRWARYSLVSQNVESILTAFFQCEACGEQVKPETTRGFHDHLRKCKALATKCTFDAECTYVRTFQLGK